MYRLTVDKIRLAVIGIGHPHTCTEGGEQGSYLETLRQIPELEVAAFCGRETERRFLFSPFSHLPIYSSVPELLAKEDFDAAMVTLPNNEAPHACVQLAEAGKHIMAEKPVARNGREMETVVQTVAKNRIKFTAGYCWRFHPIAKEMKKILRENALGRTYFVDARWLTSFIGSSFPLHRSPDHFLFKKEISGGGIFMWLGVHLIDLLLYFMDSEVASVSAHVDNASKAQVDVEDGGTTILRFRQGTTASLSCGYYLPEGNESFINLYGSRGWARWNIFQPLLQLFTASEDPGLAEKRAYDPFKDCTGYCGKMGIDLLRDWISAISEDRQPMNTAMNALSALKVVDAIYASSAEERLIKVEI